MAGSFSSDKKRSVPSWDNDRYRTKLSKNRPSKVGLSTVSVQTPVKPLQDAPLSG